MHSCVWLLSLHIRLISSLSYCMKYIMIDVSIVLLWTFGLFVVFSLIIKNVP